MKKKYNDTIHKLKVKYFKKVGLDVHYTYLIFKGYHNDTFRSEMLKGANPPDILDF